MRVHGAERRATRSRRGLSCDVGCGEEADFDKEKMRGVSAFRLPEGIRNAGVWSRRMNAHKIIQALWPGLLLLGSVSSLGTIRDVWLYLLIAVLGLWFFSAVALHPTRPWSWWACLTPLAIGFIAAVGCIGGLLYKSLSSAHPAVWTDANNPVALAIVVAFLYLILPSALLFHLFFIRRQFHAPARA